MESSAFLLQELLVSAEAPSRTKWFEVNDGAQQHTPTVGPRYLTTDRRLVSDRKKLALQQQASQCCRRPQLPVCVTLNDFSQTMNIRPSGTSQCPSDQTGTTGRSMMFTIHSCSCVNLALQ